MRRVLILAYDFPPRGAAGALRVTKFARYLPEFGWQPIVVAATVEGGMRDDGLLAELPPGLEVMRVRNPLTRRSHHSSAQSATAPRPGARSRLRRFFIPDPQVVWVPGAVQAATVRLRRGDIDAFITSAPPHSDNIAGLWLKRRFRQLPWVLDLRDMWSDSPGITDPMIYKLNRLCEQPCLHHANHIVVVSDGLRALLQRNYAIPTDRISTITNGFDAEDIPQDKPEASHEPLRLSYVGSIVDTRVDAARGFFEALRSLVAEGINSDDLEVRLVGVFAPEIWQLAEPLLEQGIVKTSPFVPHSEAVAEMASADVLLLLVPEDRERRITYTSKVFEYFAVGRPILALAPEGDLTQLIRSTGAGTTLSPGDVPGISRAIRSMIEQHKNGTLPRFPRNDPRFARFERRTLTESLARILDQLVV